MHVLSESELFLALLALAVILTLARVAAELARRIGQPEVLGELFAGFLLGPSIFGVLLPHFYHSLFLSSSVSLVLSGFSWLGAVLLLLLAGLEVDLAILRQHARPGALAGAFAIIPSLIAGSLFAWLILGKSPPGGLFLGIVLSVTGVSVVAKILIERGETRRGYAQVILAGGVASEVLVWPLVSVVSSVHSASPLQAGAIHTAYALGFFLIVMTAGKRFVFWAMRRVRDATWIVKGQLTLVLILTFVAAAATQGLGLHALLGAFVVGVLLAQAPRTNEGLLDGLRSLTVGLFGPIFFALAGMRVDILKLGSPSAIGTILLLLITATAVKVGLGTLGARLGGQRSWEAMLVGVGLNLKGGSDVVVAVVGTELGLLSARAYTMYTVVAILTVLFSPPLMAFLSRRAPPSEQEKERLEKEEASRRAYVAKIERVLVAINKPLLGSQAAAVVHQIAKSKHRQGQIFDIREFDVEAHGQVRQTQPARKARERLNEVGSLSRVELTRETVPSRDIAQRILDASRDFDLIAIGAQPPDSNGALSFGRLQDSIIDEAEADVLVAIDHDAGHFDPGSVRRILVPTNGLEYSMAAGDIAGSLADSCGAALTLLHVVQPTDGKNMGMNLREELRSAAAGVIEELTFRISRLGVHVDERIEVSADPAQCILDTLKKDRYDLIVMGGIDRGRDRRVYLGRTIQRVLTPAKTPAILLVGHDGTGPTE